MMTAEQVCNILVANTDPMTTTARQARACSRSCLVVSTSPPCAQA